MRDGPGYITSKITILAISEINMELGTFYAVFTQYWGFGPLTWNINRKSMLKPKFAMVHVNQRKRCSILQVLVIWTI